MRLDSLHHAMAYADKQGYPWFTVQWLWQPTVMFRRNDEGVLPHELLLGTKTAENPYESLEMCVRPVYPYTRPSFPRSQHASVFLRIKPLVTREDDPSEFEVAPHTFFYRRRLDLKKGEAPLLSKVLGEGVGAAQAKAQRAPRKKSTKSKAKAKR